MAEFNFVENAEAIYEKSISATPFPMRSMVKRGLTELLQEHYGDEEITEAKIIDVGSCIEI